MQDIYGNQKMPKRLLFPIGQLKIATNSFVVDPLLNFGPFNWKLMGSGFTTFEATELLENGDFSRFRENKVRTDSQLPVQSFSLG